MAVIFTGIFENQLGFIVRDENGKLLGFFPETERGLAQAENAAWDPATRRRGKTYVPMATDLPKGYGVLCVIDHENDTVHFLAIVAGEILSYEHSTFDNTREVAVTALPGRTAPNPS